MGTAQLHGEGGPAGGLLGMDASRAGVPDRGGGGPSPTHPEGDGSRAGVPDRGGPREGDASRAGVQPVPTCPPFSPGGPSLPGCPCWEREG